VFHDGHDGTLRAADRYAARLVPRLVRALGPRGVLYVVWDEGPNSDLRGHAESSLSYSIPASLQAAL
jgi:hypothetical protein